FVIRLRTPRHELQKQKGTGNSMIPGPLFDLKFLIGLTARGVETSNRRHQKLLNLSDAMLPRSLTEQASEALALSARRPPHEPRTQQRTPATPSRPRRPTP